MFEFKGEQYSKEDLESIAASKGYTLQQLFDNNPEIKEVGKSKPVVPSVTAPAELATLDTVSSLEDISLDLVEETETVGSTIEIDDFSQETIDAKTKSREKDLSKIAADIYNNRDKVAQEKSKEKQNRFNKGYFLSNEKEEYNQWLESGKKQNISVEVSEEEVQAKVDNAVRDYMEDVPDAERNSLFYNNKKITDTLRENVIKKAQMLNDNFDALMKENEVYKQSILEGVTYDNDYYDDINRKITELQAMRVDYLKDVASLKDKELFLDAFKRSYNEADKIYNTFATVGTDLALGALITADIMTAEGGKYRSFTKDLIDIREALGKEKAEKLAKPIAVGDVSTPSDFFNWSADALINFLPSGAMALSGGAAVPLFFASGYGGKMADFALTEKAAEKDLPGLYEALDSAKGTPEEAVIQKQIDTYEKALNTGDLTKFAAATLYGGAEAVFEKLTTLKLVDDLKSASVVFEKEGFKNGIKQALKEYPIAPALESAGEGATQITQNVVDIAILDADKSVMEGVDEGMAQGFLIGNGFKTIEVGTIAKAAVMDAISTNQEKAEIKTLLSEINALELSLENLPENEKPAINETIQQKIKNVAALQDITAANFLKLSKEKREEILEKDREARSLAKRWKKISTSNISQEAKEIVRKDLAAQFEVSENRKASLLAEGDIALARKNHNRWITSVREHNRFTKAANKIIEFTQNDVVTINEARKENANEATLEDGTVVDRTDMDNIISTINSAGLFRNNNIYINLFAGVPANGEVALHEYTHAVLNKAGFKEEDFNKIENDFKELLKTKLADNKITQEDYNDIIEQVAGYENFQSEELLTVTSEAIARKAIDKTDTSFLSKFAKAVKNAITPLVGKQEAEQFNIDTAENAYAFLEQMASNVLSKETRNIIKAAGEEVEKEVTRFSKKTIASEKVQQIYDEQGEAGAMDIIDLFKPITAKLANKYRDVPGFDFEFLQSEIEIGKRGLFDLIRSYDPSKGVPLAAHINTNLSRRSIEAANRILKTDFELDVTESKGVAATETASEIVDREETPEVKEVQAKSLRKEIGLTEELVETVKNAVIKTFGTKLPHPEDPKFKLELQKAFRTELKKPISKFVGTRANYENFLRDNFEAIYAKLPQSLLNKRFDEFIEPVLGEDGKQLREKTAEGNKIFTKKKISKAEFIKYFLGAELGSSTKGARKTTIVEAIAEEIAFDATMEVLTQSDVYEKYMAIGELLDNPLPENSKALVAKAIDRGEDFKFSNKVLESFKDNYGIGSQEAARLMEEKTIDQLVSEYPKLEFDEIFVERRLNKIANNLENFAVPLYTKRAKEVETIAELRDLFFEFLYVARSIRSLASPKLDKKGEKILRGQKVASELRVNQGIYDNLIVNIFPAEFEGKGLIEFENNKFYFNGQEVIFSNYYVQSGKEALVTNYEAAKAKHDRIADNNRDYLFNFLEKLKASERQDGFDFIQLIKHDQRGIVRSSFRIGKSVKNPKKAIKDPNKKDKRKFEYLIAEHNMPVDEFVNEIAKYLDGKITIAELRAKHAEARINIVPKVFDNAILPQDRKRSRSKEGRYAEPSKKFPGYEFQGENGGPNTNPSPGKLSKKSLSSQFANIIEGKTGIKSRIKLSEKRAAQLGKDKGRFSFFVPPNADDFVGLLYKVLGKGKEGDAQMAFLKENLLTPFAQGIREFTAKKQQAMNGMRQLKKRINKGPVKLKKRNETGFTNEVAVRVYLWSKAGMEIPGLNKGEVKDLVRVVAKSKELKEFALNMEKITGELGYPPPEANWEVGTMTTDVLEMLNTSSRKQSLARFIENKDLIFTDNNLNKLEAAFGKDYRVSLESALERMVSGRKKYTGLDKQTNMLIDWMNGAVGNIMFFNTRSAILQLLSIVNFTNFTDNNILNQAKLIIGNPRQYGRDFAFLANSDFIKQRISGLKNDVNADDIAQAAEDSKNPVRAFLATLLKAGFLPTQAADATAIITGGAAFYRNRANKYIKEGLSQKEAEDKAFLDFQEIAEETQQSSRDDRISKVQAGGLGRIVFAFANTSMQYARLVKKASLDLVNGRGDWKENMSKILYYGAIQNIIFAYLQQAVFAVAGGELDDDEEEQKYLRAANSVADSLLRGSGLPGAILSTVKNIVVEAFNQMEQDRPQMWRAGMQATTLSPPINAKVRQFVNATNRLGYKSTWEDMEKKGLSLENPAFQIGAEYVSAVTNAPTNRALRKIENLQAATAEETKAWQSIALAAGWSEWDLGMVEERKPKKKIKKDKRLQQKTLKQKSF